VGYESGSMSRGPEGSGGLLIFGLMQKWNKYGSKTSWGED